MDSAAMSISRTAIHFRPVLPLAKFSAMSVSTVTIPKVSKYMASGDVNGLSKITIG